MTYDVFWQRIFFQRHCDAVQAEKRAQLLQRLKVANDAQDEDELEDWVCVASLRCHIAG